MHPGDPRGQPLSDAQAVNLDTQNIGKFIDHQTAKTIGIGVHHPERVAHLWQAQEIDPVVHSPVDQISQNRLLDKRFSPMEKPQRHLRARMPQAIATGRTRLVVHMDPVTRPRADRGIPDHGRVHHRLLRVVFQPDPGCLPMRRIRLWQRRRTGARTGARAKTRAGRRRTIIRSPGPELGTIKGRHVASLIRPKRL